MENHFERLGPGPYNFGLGRVFRGNFLDPAASWGMKVSHWVCAIFHSALIE